MMVVVKVDDPSNSSDQPCRNSGCEQRKQWDLGHPGHTHTHTNTRPRANSLLLALIRS